MKIFRAGASPSLPSDPARYTGEVWTDDLADGAPPHRTHVARVSFSPGARTAWHTYPFGQILHVISGIGLVCRAAEHPILLTAGDTIAIAPGERHWHGATLEHAFVHLAIQDADDEGCMATWEELVDEETYRIAARRSRLPA